MSNWQTTYRIGALLVLLGFTAAAKVQAETVARTYSFGIVPQQAASKLLKNWGPLLKWL